MSQFYSFSPLTSKIQFETALEYIVLQAGKLSEELTGTRLRLSNAKVFAHYPKEYAFLKKIITDYGEKSKLGRSTSIYVETSLDIAGSQLKQIGIRIPDPHRSQVGCGDYELENPRDFVESLPKNKYGFIRPFPDLPDKMYELWHPDLDVTGYILL